MGVYRSKKVYLGAWHYVGLTILYAIPVIGWIIAAVHAADHNKENRLHYARFFLIRLAAAVVIVGAYIAAVYFVRGGDFLNKKLLQFQGIGDRLIGIISDSF